MKRYDDSSILLLHLMAADAAVDDYIAKTIYRCFPLLEKNDARMTTGRYGDAEVAAPHCRVDHLESLD